MASSNLLTQTICQPHVAAAVSHLSAMFGGSRVMSTQTGGRIRERSLAEKDKQLASVSKTDIGIEHELMQISELSLLLRDSADSVSTPTTSLVHSARSAGQTDRWTDSHTSASSFFENKTGFPAHQLDMNHQLTLPSLQTVSRDPMFRKIFKSLVHTNYTQQRGFKTRRSGGGKSGMGGSKEDDSFKDKIDELFGKSSSSGPELVMSTDQPIGSIKETDKDKMYMAFAKGYMKGEENGKKDKTRKSWRYWAIGICLTLYLASQLANVSIKAGGGLGGFLNSGTYKVNPEDVNVNFADVMGASEAKQELQDVVNFLRDPDKYTGLGAKLPKGVLLVGPPGVGKTLLARAVAGEAGVPFFHASGSEFDELFVGLGAKRIRQLFTAAKEQAPCIIFIDEFDSVGAKRTSSAIHPHANQTVNQLLSEMDGFQQNEGIIVMGATNKVDNMDKALRRPGRFDVEVTVSLPDLKGRKEIIELYISKIKKDANVDIDKLAKGTTGFSGAELENLINQAALKAVIDGRETVTHDHLEYARDKIIMGPEKKHRIPDEETNWITAVHESGHTLVAYYSKEATPLHKVTIIPRGQSLGHTSFIDEKEQYNKTVAQLKAQMDVAMGGRAAEELVFGTEKVTTGASSDLNGATRIATAMVMGNGMSEKVGLRTFEDRKDISPGYHELIDAEIRRLLQESYDRAKNILKQHQTELNNLSHALMKYETLDKVEIKTVVDGKKLDKVV